MDLGLSSLLELPSVQPLGSVEPGRFSMRSTSAPEQRSISLSMQDLEKSGHIRPVRHLNRAKVSLPPMWLTIAILLGASLLFVSLCGGIRRLQSGATLRQLADGDGEGEPSFSGNPFFTEQDWIPLDADELEALCGQVGQWAPSSARHSASSSSLRTVDAAAGSKGYTAGYDMGNMQSPGSVSSGPSNGQQAQAFSSTQPKGKRPSEQYGNEWGDNPVKVGRFAYDSSPGADGPAESSGVQRLEGTVQHTTDTASVYPTDLGLSQLSPPFVHQGPAYEAADRHTTREVMRDSMLELVYSSDAPTEASSVPSANADPTLQSFRGPIEAFLPQGVWVQPHYAASSARLNVGTGIFVRCPHRGLFCSVYKRRSYFTVFQRPHRSFFTPRRMGTCGAK
ncbi:hypothetical protein, conserved [Eimeria praecox]|uniref:Transmembrane protein n=1 Tax=Eimeria praecox TaxID=51316 RepID=U6GT58_9EIME|nr:hypothetical protein, conserved [Eimeria praecox]